MKTLLIPVLCLTFLFTGTTSWHPQRVNLAENHFTAPTVTPTPLPTVCTGFGCQHDAELANDLLKDEYVTRMAGAKLSLDVPNGWSSASALNS